MKESAVGPSQTFEKCSPTGGGVVVRQHHWTGGVIYSREFLDILGCHLLLVERFLNGERDEQPIKNMLFEKWHNDKKCFAQILKINFRENIDKITFNVKWKNQQAG